MIYTLAITILIEGIVVTGYSFRRKKPFVRILLVSVIANLLTQSMLWALLNLFSGNYLITLFVSEVFIWLIEGAILHLFPGTQLGWLAALMLSLWMNLASFCVGWFLPI